VLLADPQDDMLIVHPAPAVSALLAALHRSATMAIDAVDLSHVRAPTRREMI
jgi:hypothetical protein